MKEEQKDSREVEEGCTRESVSGGSNRTGQREKKWGESRGIRAAKK